MHRIAASLAAVLAAAAPALGCGGGDGAEPGAPTREATLVLDFAPNAAHTGIYAALASGRYAEEGIDLTVRQPSASTDAPKLLETGQADLAILDIQDLGIAVQNGLRVAGVSAIVGRPLAAVLAAPGIGRPRDLEGRAVGVTGLPSDDAVLDTVVAADGGDPERVRRVTIGFNAVAALAGGRVDAATAFWSAEGIALRERGVPVREFRVEEFGAPAYPELILTATPATIEDDPELVEGMIRATTAGYEDTIDDPERALEALLEAAPGLERATQQAQLEVLLPAFGEQPGRLEASTLAAWVRWAAEHGILARIAPVAAFFEPRYVED